MLPKVLHFLISKKGVQGQELLPLKMEIVRVLHQKQLKKRIQEYDKELVGELEEQEAANGKHR